MYQRTRPPFRLRYLLVVLLAAGQAMLVRAGDLPDGCEMDGDRLTSCARFTGDTLVFDRLGIRTVDASAFTGLRLQHLTFIEPAMDAWPVEALGGLTLLSLTFKEAKVTAVRVAGATEMSHLTTLILADLPRLWYFPDNIFADATQITTLEVTNCPQLVYLATAVVAPLRHLMHMDISNNGLRSLGAGLFDSLPSLQTWDISGNDFGDQCSHSAGTVPTTFQGQLYCVCDGLESDLDSDGFVSCADPCPDVYLSHGDYDDDGIMDCRDPCMMSADHVDSDGDGVLDCKDQCPGEADTDTDGDGEADCVDLCPDDPDTTDSDFDGIPDCADQCPGEPDYNFANPGVLACAESCEGGADLDSDGDGVADCHDACPTNADYADDEGPCGCDAIDSDGDGVLDCEDACPTNAAYGATIGACGCDGVDSDGDGVLDCEDACPTNAAYGASIGACGCDGVDSDGDGVLDCEDACPTNAAYGATIGACGCDGVDSDGDGVLDCEDECLVGRGTDADADGNGMEDGCHCGAGEWASARNASCITCPVAANCLLGGVCATGSSGVACGTCSDGFFADATRGNRCTACSESLWWLVPALAALSTAVVLACALRRCAGAETLAAVRQLASHGQLVAAVMSLDAAAWNSGGGVAMALQAAVMDMTALPPSCAVRGSWHTQLYATLALEATLLLVSAALTPLMTSYASNLMATAAHRLVALGVAPSMLQARKGSLASINTLASAAQRSSRAQWTAASRHSTRQFGGAHGHGGPGEVQLSSSAVVVTVGDGCLPVAPPGNGPTGCTVKGVRGAGVGDRVKVGSTPNTAGAGKVGLVTTAVTTYSLHGSKLAQKLRAAGRPAQRFTATLLLVACAPTATMLMRAFDCIYVPVVTASGVTTALTVLRADTSINCDSAQHLQAQLVAGVVLALLVAAPVLLLGYRAAMAVRRPGCASVRDSTTELRTPLACTEMALLLVRLVIVVVVGSTSFPTVTRASVVGLVLATHAVWMVVYPPWRPHTLRALCFRTQRPHAWFARASAVVVALILVATLVLRNVSPGPLHAALALAVTVAVAYALAWGYAMATGRSEIGGRLVAGTPSGCEHWRAAVEAALREHSYEHARRLVAEFSLRVTLRVSYLEAWLRVVNAATDAAPAPSPAAQWDIRAATAELQRHRTYAAMCTEAVQTPDVSQGPVRALRASTVAQVASAALATLQQDTVRCGLPGLLEASLKAFMSASRAHMKAAHAMRKDLSAACAVTKAEAVQAEVVALQERHNQWGAKPTPAALAPVEAAVSKYEHTGAGTANAAVVARVRASVVAARQARHPALVIAFLHLLARVADPAPAPTRDLQSVASAGKSVHGDSFLVTSAPGEDGTPSIATVLASLGADTDVHEGGDAFRASALHGAVMVPPPTSRTSRASGGRRYSAMSVHSSDNDIQCDGCSSGDGSDVRDHDALPDVDMAPSAAPHRPVELRADVGASATEHSDHPLRARAGLITASFRHEFADSQCNGANAGDNGEYRGEVGVPLESAGDPVVGIPTAGVACGQFRDVGGHLSVSFAVSHHTSGTSRSSQGSCDFLSPAGPAVRRVEEQTTLSTV